MIKTRSKGFWTSVHVTQFSPVQLLLLIIWYVMFRFLCH